MRHAKLCLVGLFALTAIASTAAHADRVRSDRSSPSQYFVDFRARPGGVFGHTYVVYGRMDARGRILQPTYAGLYPGGPFSQTVLLAVLVVPGKVSTEPADHKHVAKLVYRRRLSPSSYARLERAVQAQRKTPQAWDLLLYNCNSFAAEVANAIGLHTPPTLEFPTDFVRDLYMMNRSGPPASRYKTTARTRRIQSRPPRYRDVLFHFDHATGAVRAWR